MHFVPVPRPHPCTPPVKSMKAHVRGPQPCCTLGLAIRCLFLSILLLVTNYLTWMVSGGIGRMRGGGGGGVVSPLVTELSSEGGRYGVRVKPSKGKGGVAAGSSVVGGGGGGGGGAGRVGGRGGGEAAAPLPPRLLPEVSSPYADFCTPPEVDEDQSEEHAASVAAAQWDSVSTWPVASLRALAEHECYLTTLNQERDLGFLPVYICTHDPTLDQVMAASFHAHKWWGANLDHRFLLGGGYAGGTPLRPLEAGLLRSAVAHATLEGKDTPPHPFPNLAALTKAMPLPPVTPGAGVRSMCSRERPFVLDVGGNIGYYTLVAASMGCSVVTIEPLSANVGRLWQSVVANRFEGQVTLFKNAVGKDRRLVTLALNRGNPGASSVSDAHAEAPEGGGKASKGGGLHESGDSETVATVVLDELFDGGENRPKHPFTGLPISPKDIAVIKVDVEGFDAAALWAMRGAIEAGRPPLIKVEYMAGDVRGTSGCDNEALITWLYDLGYQGRAMGRKKPLTLKQWQKTIIPLLLEGKMEELHEKHDLPVVRELYMVLKGVDMTGLKGLFGGEEEKEGEEREEEEEEKEGSKTN